MILKPDAIESSVKIRMAGKAPHEDADFILDIMLFAIRLCSLCTVCDRLWSVPHRAVCGEKMRLKMGEREIVSVRSPTYNIEI